ncbi:surface lipoprotein assembly modifier [Pseudoalteromonas sp. SA25]|uniref:surface lipoprotein assembly modifier n=1 Tax=Pseudoalteromonas sp. SA25 TaxID=2686347 RepID=UPI0013FD4997
MIKQLLRNLLCSYLALISFSSLAQINDEYDNLLIELQKLVFEKKYTQAYEKSNSEFQYLGEPVYDFLLGVSALKTGNAAPAVFAFERVVENNPRWYEARLYLVRAYLTVNNLPAADTQALILINSPNTPNNIKFSAQSLLDTTTLKKQEAGRSYKQNIELALGVDGNVNAGTAENTIIIPNIGEFLLSPESKSTQDNYARLNYRGKYSHPIDQKSLITLSVNTGWYKFAELSQYDRINTHISAAYQYKQNDISWFAQVSTTPLMLDGDLYRTESALTAGASYKLNTQVNLFSSATAGVLNNKFDEKLDNSFYAINAGASYATRNWFQSLSINAKNEEADITEGEFNSRNITSLYYQVNTQPAQHWQLLSLAGYQWINYKDDHPLFLQERADNLFMFSTSVRYLVNRDLAIQLAANYQDKSSNISLFEYDRLDINLSASYSF